MNKLNLGCGNDYREGYINCDCTNLVKVDKILDLEKIPLPFKDNSIDEIIAYHILEHINNFIPLMHELHRICKKGAKIYIKTPFYTGWGQWNDPTHVRFFSIYTFQYFQKGNYSHEVGCNKDMFNYKVKINYAIGRASPYFNWFFNPLINLSDFTQQMYSRFFCWIFPAVEIQYVLEVIK